MIDILMSTYNGARFLEAQIDSILNQTHREFRLIIRDDRSSDETVKILEKYRAADSRIFILEDDLGNLGAPRSFMTLVERAEAPFFMFSDQDDVWLADKIRKSLDKIKILEEKNGTNAPLLVFTDLAVTDEKLQETQESFWRFQRLDPRISADWKNLLAQNVVTGCTIIANEKAKAVALPFVLDEMLHDHWIAVNVARHGQIDYLSERTVLYRQHGRNLEGVKRFGAKYAFSKIPKLFESIAFYRRAARFFGDVSTSELLQRKISLNLKRFRAGSVL